MTDLRPGLDHIRRYIEDLDMCDVNVRMFRKRILEECRSPGARENLCPRCGHDESNPIHQWCK